VSFADIPYVPAPSVTVTVTEASITSVTIDADDVTLPNNNTGTILRWDYSNVDSCSVLTPPIPALAPGDGSGSVATGQIIGSGSHTYTMSCSSAGSSDSDSVTINVSAPAVPLSLEIKKTGQGTVKTESNPVQTDISCGAICTVSYEQGTTVVLTATPDSGRIFTGWSGNCSGKGNCNLIMDGAKTVTANFVIDPNFKEF